jgi:transposase InsO family protein
MNRKGNPWDNAACESFMKTLKYEQGGDPRLRSWFMLLLCAEGG